MRPTEMLYHNTQLKRQLKMFNRKYKVLLYFGLIVVILELLYLRNRSSLSVSNLDSKSLTKLDTQERETSTKHEKHSGGEEIIDNSRLLKVTTVSSIQFNSV